MSSSPRPSRCADDEHPTVLRPDCASVNLCELSRAEPPVEDRPKRCRPVPRGHRCRAGGPEPRLRSRKVQDGKGLPAAHRPHAVALVIVDRPEFWGLDRLAELGWRLDTARLGVPDVDRESGVFGGVAGQVLERPAEQREHRLPGEAESDGQSRDRVMPLDDAHTFGSTCEYRADAGAGGSSDRCSAGGARPAVATQVCPRRGQGWASPDRQPCEPGRAG